MQSHEAGESACKLPRLPYLMSCDVRPGTLLHCISQAHRLACTALALDAGGRFLASGGGDCLMKLWTLPQQLVSMRAQHQQK